MEDFMRSAASMITLAVAALASAALSVAACSNPTQAETPNPYATEVGFCRELAKTLCNSAVVQACYLSDEKTLTADTDRCVQELSLPARCNPAGLPYHVAGAAACIAAGAAAYGDAKLTMSELVAYRDECLAAFSHNGSKDSACISDSDCDGSLGLRCLLRADAGTCQIPEEVMPGMDCSAPAAWCSDGFYCDSGEHCVATQSVGKSCAAAPCDDESNCDPTTKQCVAKKDNGASCENPSDCSGGFCVKATGQTMGTCGSTWILSPTNDTSCEPFKAE
jgi:hypothetical protein